MSQAHSAITAPANLEDIFGPIDIYLFDQILRRRFTPAMRILDAGCGSGRNLRYFMRSGFEVFGVDMSDANVKEVRTMASALAPQLPTANFRVENINKLSFDSGYFDAIVCNAVLHFAQDPGSFRSMLNELWRVLKPGGIFFARLASSIGIESRIQALGDNRFRLPDGSDRFLVDEETLVSLTDELHGSLLDPIKTVNVQGQRCMTNWCIQKVK